MYAHADRHDETPRTCRLALIDQGRCLRVEVDDTSRIHHESTLRTGRRTRATAGRPARLDLGVQRHAHHKTVWAELALDHAGSSGHARHLATTSNWQDGT
jgi:hypothetical protein